MHEESKNIYSSYPAGAVGQRSSAVIVPWNKKIENLEVSYT